MAEGKAYATNYALLWQSNRKIFHLLVLKAYMCSLIRVCVGFLGNIVTGCLSFV